MRKDIVEAYRRELDENQEPRSVGIIEASSMLNVAIYRAIDVLRGVDILEYALGLVSGLASTAEGYQHMHPDDVQAMFINQAKRDTQVPS